MSQEPVPVTVLVVGHHGGPWLPACIDTLRGALQKKPWRLVVMDNGGDNGLENLSLANLNVTILKTPRTMGFADANNYALEMVPMRTDAICFLNQDTRSAPGWLDACLDCLHRCPDIGALTPLIKTYDGERWDAGFWDCARKSDEFREIESRAGEHQTWYEVPVITAAAMVVRTEALRAAGPFDPIFGSYYEDYDLCRRIHSAGFKVAICSQGEVSHYSGSSSLTMAAQQKRMRQVIRNRAIYAFRVSGDRRWRAVFRHFALTFPYNLGRGIHRTSASPPPAVQLSAHWDLLKIMRRLLSEKRDRREWHRYLDEINWYAPTITAAHSRLSDHR